MKTDRRIFMKGAGLGALLFTIDGKDVWLNAAQARKRGLEFQALSRSEARNLEALGDTLLPGAAEAGISHFVDHQLAGEPADALLLIRHLDWPGPLRQFYRQGLHALDAAAARHHGGPFARIDSAARTVLVESLFADSVEGWTGPPAPLFYLAVRSDAVDVVYGTVEGFEKLAIPYVPHILPKEAW